MYYETLNQTLLTQKYQGSPLHLFYCLEAYSFIVWHTVRGSMLQNKRIFLLVISKLMPTFSTVQLDVAQNYIN